MLSKSHLVIIDLLIVWVAIMIYILFPFDQLRLNIHNEWYFNEHISKYAIVLLGVLYIPFTIWNINKKELITDTRIGRILFIENVRKKEILIYILKWFFIPSMLSLTIQNGLVLMNYLSIIFKLNTIDIYQLFCHYIYPIIIYAVLFITTGLYAIGYILESKKLQSEIKSIDHSFIGWFVTLICYYPFYILLSNYLPMMTNDFAFFFNKGITFIVFTFLMILHLFKLWSVLCLGWKCSNLTNRGIISHGPYKWIRHPHYTMKLLIWWITFIPLLMVHPSYIIGMLFWSLIYFLRAFTEEIHLSDDQDYINYKKQVRYRFIPYLL